MYYFKTAETFHFPLRNRFRSRRHTVINNSRLNDSPLTPLYTWTDDTAEGVYNNR